MLQWFSQNSVHSLDKIRKIAVITGIFLVTVFLINTLVPSQVVAQNLPTTTAAQEVQAGLNVVQQPLGLPSTDIRIIIANIIRVALGFIGIILVVLIMYGGFLWMTAGGNEEQIGKAKKILRNAVIGLAIILSAYVIVQFVFKMLGYEGGGAGPGTEVPAVTNLYGSGALGRVVKDHYPARDQVGVPRNTKIVITFFRPIKIDTSLVTAWNVGGARDLTAKPLGSCKDSISNIADDCDRLILSTTTIDVIKVVRSKNADGTFKTTESSISGNGGAALFVSYTSGKADTIVIRPIENLGSATEEVEYKVRIGRDIKWDDAGNNNPGIFADFAEKEYYWNFICSTQLDSNPPYVVDVFPSVGSTEFKNTEIQVSFSEPVDPTGIQGIFKVTTTPAGKEYYYLEGGNLFLRIDPFEGSAAAGFPSGTMKLTGNYRVLSFTPSAVCGTNACGKPMYCLPTPENVTSSYQILLKAAKTLSEVGSKNFDSIPFSGISDMASNALDTGEKDTKGRATKHDGVVQYTAVTGDVFPNSLNADNYWWQFDIMDDIDLSAPYLYQVTPGLDSSNIMATQTWKMAFSKRMRVAPLYGIAMTEHPTAVERCAGRRGCVATPLWQVPNYPEFTTPTPGMSGRFVTTTVTMAHGLFLKGNDFIQYYLPELTSDIEDVGFNCFYPGLGPGGTSQTGNSNTKGLNPSGICNKETGENCCGVESSPNYKAYCCDGLSNQPSDFTNSTTCKNFVRSISPTST